jgi:hypothetical protein
MADCPTKCPDFQKYIEALATISCPEAQGYISQLAKNPAFATGVKLYIDKHPIYSFAKGSPTQLLLLVSEDEIPKGDKAKMLLGYTLRRIADKGECGLSNAMLEAAKHSGIFEDEIGIELLEKIKKHSSQISSLLK